MHITPWHEDPNYSPGILESGALQSGTLQSRATDFGAGCIVTCHWGPTVWDPTVSGYQSLALDEYAPASGQPRMLQSRILRSWAAKLVAGYVLTCHWVPTVWGCQMWSLMRTRLPLGSKSQATKTAAGYVLDCNWNPEGGRGSYNLGLIDLELDMYPPPTGILQPGIPGYRIGNWIRTHLSPGSYILGLH